MNKTMQEVFDRDKNSLFDVTLCLLVHGDEVLLAMKKRGFGAGKWNGAGGKVDSGESIEQAAIRECQEEIGVTPTHLQPIGVFNYLFDQSPPDKSWSQRMHVYLVNSWEGEPTESEEMAPQWFKIAEVPYTEMWEADYLWMPTVLKGQLKSGTILFSLEGKVLEYELS